jgi:cytochrome P450
MDAGLNPELAEPGRRARAELSVLMRSWLNPPPSIGMLGYLVEHQAAAQMGPAVLHNSVRVVFHAGYTTVSSAIGSAVHSMLHRSVDWRPLRDPQQSEAAVEELLRYDGPVQANWRVCVEDADVAGTRIHRGQTVHLMLGSANRDAEQFEQPDDIILTRHPNPHLALGGGMHACIGASLAKRVVRVALRALADFGELSISGSVEHKPQVTQRCLHRLPVSCGPVRPRLQICQQSAQSPN